MIIPKIGDYFIATTNDLYRITGIIERKPHCYVIIVHNLNRGYKYPFYFFTEFDHNSYHISKYLGKMKRHQANTAQMLYSKTITGS